MLRPVEPLLQRARLRVLLVREPRPSAQRVLEPFVVEAPAVGLPEVEVDEEHMDGEPANPIERAHAIRERVQAALDGDEVPDNVPVLAPTNGVPCARETIASISGCVSYCSGRRTNWNGSRASLESACSRFTH